MTSEEVVLNAYKNGHLSLEESLQLIRDIKGANQSFIYPQVIPTYNPNDWRVTTTTYHD